MNALEKMLGSLPLGNGGSDRPIAGEFLCVGATVYGCSAKSRLRSWYCPACADRTAQDARKQQLAQAFVSLSPQGALDWCSPANEQYQQATRKLRTTLLEKADGFGELERPKADGYRRLATGAQLPTATQGALIIGPRRIGKSKLLTAIGLRLLELAQALDAPEGLVRLASGMRFINGIALARAAMDSGGWRNSTLYHEACSATLLLLDETGYEDQKSDSTLTRDILRMRYEVPSYRPTVMASGATLEELNDRYGEAAISTVWERGLLVNLHPTPIPPFPPFDLAA